MPRVKVGDRIRIIRMMGEPQYTGMEGIVEYIDDLPQYHGTWGGLAVNPEVDEFEIIPQKDTFVIENHGNNVFSGVCIHEGVSYSYSAKVFPEPSRFGINDGRISKLCIRRKMSPINERYTTVLNYDRGWDIEPGPGDRDACEKIIGILNQLEAA